VFEKSKKNGRFSVIIREILFQLKNEKRIRFVVRRLKEI